MKESLDKKKQSRRAFILSGILGGLGALWAYDNRGTVSPFVKNLVAQLREIPRRYSVRNNPNIIIIGLDTLRADHLGCYGYHRPISPNIDAFAEDGVLYWNTMSQSNWTLPAFASLLTGLYPHNHGAVLGYNKEKTGMHTPLPTDVPSIAGILKKCGYHTAAFVGGSYVSKFSGLDQGFQDFSQAPEIKDLNYRYLEKHIVEIKTWMKGREGKKPFFLFLHTYEIHRPFESAGIFCGSYRSPLYRPRDKGGRQGNAHL